MLRFIKIAIGLTLVGCAHQPINAPSGVAVSQGISQTKGHISTAQTQNKSISSSNVQQKTLSQRIHDKDILIDRWRETHPQ